MYGKKNYEEEINTKKILNIHITQKKHSNVIKSRCVFVLCLVITFWSQMSNDMEATDKVSLVLKKMFAI